MIAALTFADLRVALDDLTAEFDELDLAGLDGGDPEAVQAAWLAITQVCRAADDLCVRARRVLTAAIVRTTTTQAGLV